MGRVHAKENTTNAIVVFPGMGLKSTSTKEGWDGPWPWMGLDLDNEQSPQKIRKLIIFSILFTGV